MAKYVSFNSSGKLFQFGSLRKTLPEIKAIKEKNGIKVFAISDSEYEQLNSVGANGCDASESGGVVTIGEPIGGLPHYKKAKKVNEKRKAKKLFVDYRDEIDTSNANASTYKASLKDYYINNVKTPVNAASDKTGVDTAIAAIDWSTVVIP